MLSYSIKSFFAPQGFVKDVKTMKRQPRNWVYWYILLPANLYFLVENFMQILNGEIIKILQTLISIWLLYFLIFAYGVWTDSGKIIVNKILNSAKINFGDISNIEVNPKSFYMYYKNKNGVVDGIKLPIPKNAYFELQQILKNRNPNIFSS